MYFTRNKIEHDLSGYEKSKYEGYLINVNKGTVINERTHRISHSVDHWSYGNNPIRVMVNIGKRKSINRNSLSVSLAKIVWEHVNEPITPGYIIRYANSDFEDNSI